jgi:chaperonin cofactor prefoldin
MYSDDTPPSTSTTDMATAADAGSASGSIADLQRQENELKRNIADLQSAYNRLLKDQAQQMQADFGRMMQQATADLEQRQRTLQMEIEKLERRRDRIQEEMRTSFAGVSQDLAVRVQGFKDYLVGSLQDLAAAAEKLELSVPTPPPPTQTERVRDEDFREPRRRPSERPASRPEAAQQIGFGSQRFQDQTERIRSLLDQYRMRPDYYGPVWQLRRTFEPIHADRIANWFFTQGGRGAVKSMGSRLQNVLVASAGISILHALHNERLQTLVLSNSPERLGEWRRGLQDCLGVSRAEFGVNRGIMLFDAPEPLAQRAERIVSEDGLPLIIIDESENVVSLSLLQFPLWLAFAPDPLNPSPPEYDFY